MAGSRARERQRFCVSDGCGAERSGRFAGKTGGGLICGKRESAVYRMAQNKSVEQGNPEKGGCYGRTEQAVFMIAG